MSLKLLGNGMCSSAGNGLIGRIQLKMPKIHAEFIFSLATDLLHVFHHNWQGNWLV